MKLYKLVEKVDKIRAKLPYEDAALLAQMIEAYEHELATLRTRANHDRHGHKEWYEKNRLLENRVRELVTVEQDVYAIKLKLIKIVKRLPNEPRKKWEWRGRVTR